jgi:hypothetical protein
MALTDIVFDFAEETNFIVEVGAGSYSGTLSDILGAGGSDELDTIGSIVEVVGNKIPSINGRHIIRSNN